MFPDRIRDDITNHLVHAKNVQVKIGIPLLQKNRLHCDALLNIRHRRRIDRVRRGRQSGVCNRQGHIASAGQNISESQFRGKSSIQTTPAELQIE